jgi:PTH2 family peptidyl-tRNA hydrolase
MNTKQVIIWNNALKCRKGKIGSQCAHASMAFLTKDVMFGTGHFVYKIPMEHKLECELWLKTSFRKIVCYVNSEEELMEIHQKALDAGLISHLVIDNGATEFNGVKTPTAVAVGPHFENKFEGITDHLPLL